MLMFFTFSCQVHAFTYYLYNECELTLSSGTKIATKLFEF